MTVTALPTALPSNSTDRLMAVADLIELHPSVYDQQVWWAQSDPPPPGEFEPGCVYGRGTSAFECATVACIAGWAVALCPRPRTVDYWPRAGADALGITSQLAAYLFSAHFDAPVEMVADMLRRIARLPEGERTLANMRLVLSDDQLAALIGVRSTYTETDDDDDDDDDADVVEFEPAPDTEDPDDVDDDPADVAPVLAFA